MNSVVVGVVVVWGVVEGIVVTVVLIGRIVVVV